MEVHALTGKRCTESYRSKQLSEVYESLHAFLQELKKDGAPFATRVIQEKTGTTTRDDDPDAIALPPHIS